MKDFLLKVQKPGRYIGGEWNSVKKDWKEDYVKVALSYPDLYEIGMSNLGIFLIYKEINSLPFALAERIFPPAVDMEEELKKRNLPPLTLESKKPLKDFDFIGFSLSSELLFTNMLNLLHLSGIPLLSEERERPIVMAGGICTLNPEPISKFVDLFIIGEGEEVIKEVLSVYKEVRGRKEEVLKELSRIEGVYVPSLGKRRVKKRFLRKLPPPPTDLIVPYIEVVHDRGVVEIQRGCTRGCRFCQAGIFYRPLRERSHEEVLRAIEGIGRDCGYSEVSLLSLSTSDYHGIDRLVRLISSRYRNTLKISLPSLRIDTFSVELMEALGGRGTITFAPEAGSERLRKIINKPVGEDEMIEVIRRVSRGGWKGVKLYFMLGLPGERDEDVEGIVRLVRNIRRKVGGIRIKLNISQFIPKPHTPFQWVRQASPGEIAPKLQILRRGLKKTGVQLSWQDPRLSLLEGVFSRGDRRLGRVVRRAWELGCLFDGWREHFKWELWQKAFWDSDLDPNFYLRERGLEELLPWSHIDSGVSSAYLRRELERSRRGEPTPDCRSSCQACGLQRWDKTCRDKLRQSSEKA